MAISESRLETWANQGAITTAKLTADSIKNALNSYTDWPDGIDFEVYLQGSYKNEHAKKADTYFQEMVVLTHKVDRHEKWFHEITEKLGVKLQY